MNSYLSFSDIISVVALAVSIGTAIFSLIKYYKFDKRIAEQQLSRNSIQLAEAVEKAENNKKANVELNFINDNKSSGVLKVFNKGISSAVNIRIQLVGDLTFFQSLKEPIAIERLDHLQHKDHKVFLMSNHPSQLKAVVSWSDNYKKDQTKEVIVYF